MELCSKDLSRHSKQTEWDEGRYHERVVSTDGSGMYQYQSETKRQRTAYTRYQALELEKVAHKLQHLVKVDGHVLFRPPLVLVDPLTHCYP